MFRTILTSKDNIKNIIDKSLFCVMRIYLLFTICKFLIDNIDCKLDIDKKNEITRKDF